MAVGASTEELVRPLTTKAYTSPIAREPVFGTSDGLKSEASPEPSYVNLPEPEIAVPPVVISSIQENAEKAEPSLDGAGTDLREARLPDKELTLEDASKIVEELLQDLKRLVRERRTYQGKESESEEKRKLAAIVLKRLQPLTDGATQLALSLFDEGKVVNFSPAGEVSVSANQPMAEKFPPPIINETPDAISASSNSPERQSVEYTIQPGDSLSSIIARFNPNKGYLDENGVFKMDDATQAQLHNDLADLIGINPQILEWNPDLANAIGQEAQSLGESPRGTDLKALVRKVGGPNEVINIHPGAVIRITSSIQQ